MAKKNCRNCRYLEYFEADYESSDSSGFYCNKREPTEKLENSIQKESYREKSKICFEAIPEFTKAERAFLRLVERVSPEKLDMNQKMLIKELESR